MHSLGLLHLYAQPLFKFTAEAGRVPALFFGG